MIDIYDILEGRFSDKRYDCHPSLYNQILEELTESKLDKDELINIQRFLEQSAADHTAKIIRKAHEWNKDNARFLIKRTMLKNFITKISRLKNI